MANSSCVSGGPAPAPPAPFSVWPLHNMTAQLFNLTVDPREREDVAAQHPDVVARLAARLAQWGVTARDPYWRTAVKDGNPTQTVEGPAWVPWLD